MRSKLSGPVSVCAALLMSLGAAWSEPRVTLTSLDGASKVEGELMGFDGQIYTVLTGFGVVTITAAQVTCAGEGCPARPVEFSKFTIQGSNTIGDGLIPALIEGYADTLDAELVSQVGAGENERVLSLTGADGEEIAVIEISAHGTEIAFSALADGTTTLGLASRRMAGAEGGLADLRDGQDEHVLAIDGLIMIVHPDNPVRALTLDQIADVFAGRINNWDQLGGSNLPVKLYARDDRSGTLEAFKAMVMRPRKLRIAASAERLEDNADLSDLVSNDTAGIGFTSIAFARASRPLAIRQTCGLISFPTTFDIKTEEYPLARRLYIYGSGTAMGAHAKGFLEFALSDAAQPIIAGTGFADRRIETQGIESQGSRLAYSLTSPEEFSLDLFREMLTHLKEAVRLSMTFRFAADDSVLEARSQNEAERFARLMADGAYADEEVYLVGFTSADGDFDVNLDLALRRAQNVLDTLKASVPEGALDGVRIQVQSYGELTPVACNDIPRGRALNRRVEVWVPDR